MTTWLTTSVVEMTMYDDESTLMTSAVAVNSTHDYAITAAVLPGTSYPPVYCCMYTVMYHEYTAVSVRCSTRYQWT